MKIIIIDSCQVNYGDDRGGVHEESGSIVDVSKEMAGRLTAANRALYVDKKDDPFKDGRFTASADMVKAAERLAKSNKVAAEKKAPSQPSGGGGDLTDQSQG